MVTKSLRNLSLVRCCPIDRLAIVLEGVSTNQTIESLVLSGCKLRAQDLVQSLLPALGSNTSLRNLNLSNNPTLGDEGAIVLAKALLNNEHEEAVVPVLQHVQQLVLSYCGLGNVGVTEIAKCLETNTTLRALDLSSNLNVENDGAIAMAHALTQKNKSLARLCMGYCRIGNLGAIALANMLQHNNTMEFLEFRMNMGTTDKGQQALLDSLFCNTSLLELLVTDTLNERANGHVAINRFKRTYLARNRTSISPGLWTHVFARVADKPSVLFLFLQENYPKLLVENTLLS
jgi:hypothetical protein